MRLPGTFTIFLRCARHRPTWRSEDGTSIASYSRCLNVRVRLHSRSFREHNRATCRSKNGLKKIAHEIVAQAFEMGTRPGERSWNVAFFAGNCSAIRDAPRYQPMPIGISQPLWTLCCQSRQGSRAAQERSKNQIATITSSGRSVGDLVFAQLRDRGRPAGRSG